MVKKTLLFDWKNLRENIDWTFLLFLLLFLDVKIFVKILAFILIYVLQFNFALGFKLKNSRLPLFYPLIIIIAIACLLVNGNYTQPTYLVVFFTGSLFWVGCILVVHQVKLFVERTGTIKIHNTISTFFIINAVISFLNLAFIIWHTKAINPYLYQGEYQKYFLNTGDYIKGVTFDTSNTNAVLNAFGVVYFLEKKQPVLLLTCMLVLLFTCSNFINIILLLILMATFLLKANKDQKSLIVICCMLLVVFMVKISPQNNTYVTESLKNFFGPEKTFTVKPKRDSTLFLQKPYNILSTDERREKIATLYLDSVRKACNVAITPKIGGEVITTDAGRIIVPKPDINSAPYQNLATTPASQNALVDFANKHTAVLKSSEQTLSNSKMPGKVLSIIQTVKFFKQHPFKLIIGDGMGNFSSKLAFRVSGLGMGGGYPEKYRYINPDFLVNHLELYLNYFTRRAGMHSLTNSPFSIYDQLLSEYGLLGLAVFVICYLGYFLKHLKVLTYGVPILVLTLAILFIDYWFEQLSVLVLFELFLLLNIKESSLSTT